MQAMSKNWLLALLTTAVLIGSGLFFAVHLYRLRHQAHFFVGVSGGNASVSLGSFDLGTAPIKDVTLPPGWYEFKLTTDYYTYQLPVRLTQATATVIDWQVATDLEHSHGIIYELLPAPTTNALLTVATTPDKAQVIIDEQDQTFFSPIITQAFTPGAHTLQLTIPGYETQTIPFSLTPGYELKLTVKLAQDE